MRPSQPSGPAGIERAEALFFVEPRRAEIRTLRLDRPQQGQALVRALASGISQGSELLVYRGEAGLIDGQLDPSLPSSDAAAKAKVPEPSLPSPPGYPLRYGYASVGEVVAVADDAPEAERAWLGRRVFALEPHQSAYLTAIASLRRLPDEIDPLRGIFAANLETAINAVWDAQLGLGDQVAVLGQGIVGLLIAALAVKSGARVLAVEPDPRRAHASRQLGAAWVHAPGDRALTRHEGRCDVVFEATGQPAALDEAVRLAGFEARVVVVSNYGRRRAPVDLGPLFHRRRLSLCSSQVSTVAASHRSRWDAARRFALCAELLGGLPLDRLVDRRVQLADLPGLFAELDKDPTQCLQIAVDYRLPGPKAPERAQEEG